VTRAAQLSAFADQDPANPILLCDLLDELLATSELDHVRARLQRIAPDMRRLPAVQFRAARCALVSKDFAVAVDVLQSLIAAQEPAPAGAVHDLAFAQLMLGLHEQALQTLGAASPQGDDVVAVALLKARIFHHRREHAAALETLAGFAEGPRLAEVCGLRALLHLDDGDNTYAAFEADHALDLDPRQHEALIVRGTLALWGQQLELSSAVFEQVLTEHPDSGRALLGLGQDLMLRGNIATSRALLEKAARAMPEHLGTWHALAWCQLIEGDLAGAKRSFDQAFAVDRTFGETHGGIALVHALRGERSEAEESIKRAARLDPQVRSARYARSVLLLDEGRVDEARRTVDELLAQSPRRGVPIPADFIFKLRDLVRPRG
jgi:tetratricopeptide (TPR) repeat protein